MEEALERGGWTERSEEEAVLEMAASSGLVLRGFQRDWDCRSAEGRVTSEPLPLRLRQAGAETPIPFLPPPTDLMPPKCHPQIPLVTSQPNGAGLLELFLNK